MDDYLTAKKPNARLSSRSLSSESSVVSPELMSVSSRTSTVATDRTDDSIVAEDARRSDEYDQRLQHDLNVALEKSRSEM